MNMQEFVKKHNIKMEAQFTGERTDGIKWDNAYHYRCIFDNEFVIEYSMGYAHTDEPIAKDVLDCLASDAASIENANGEFNDWCAEYGYDNDSISVLKVFRACKKQSRQLKEYLGESAYSELLWETERI